MANKIGTYMLAVLAAPPRAPARRRRADLDGRPRHAGGTEIPVEERVAARGLRALPGRNPAFDVTPARAGRVRSSPRRASTGRPTHVACRGRRAPGARRVKAMVMAAGPRHEAAAAHGLPPEADDADRESAGPPPPPEPARRPRRPRGRRQHPHLPRADHGLLRRRLGARHVHPLVGGDRAARHRGRHEAPAATSGGGRRSSSRQATACTTST